MVLLHRKVIRRRLFVVLALLIVLLVFTLVEIAIFSSRLESAKYATFQHRSQQTEHRLCVTIPYRDRWKELQQMLPLLHNFLATTQSITTARYIVVNQSEKDALRFNRAALVNIGALQAESAGCDYMAIHDVDIEIIIFLATPYRCPSLLPYQVVGPNKSSPRGPCVSEIPLNPNLSYHYPNGHIMHIASGKYHPIKRYDYKNFIGSVLVITLADFKKVNGMSNEFWGWGLEDDDFYLRLKNAGMANGIERPSNLSTNRSNTFLHLHDGRWRRRDYSVDEYRKKRRRKRNNLSGLRTLNYTMDARRTIELGEEHIEIWVFDVHLYCEQIFATECHQKI